MFSFGLTRQSVCHHCRYRRVLDSFAQSRQRRPRIFHPTRRYLSDVQYKSDPFDDVAGATEEWEKYEDNAPNTAASIRDRTGGTGVRRLTLNLNKLALEVSTLGQPASILRFDVDGHKKRRLKWERESNDQIREQLEKEEGTKQDIKQDASNDIAQALSHGTRALSEAETTAAIEEMKDEWLGAMDQQSIPTAANCWEFFERLEQSFSVPQLTKYLADTAQDDAFDYDDLEGAFKSSMCTRSPWVSHNSGLQSENPGSLLSGATAKHGQGIQPWLLASYAKKQKKTKSRVWKPERKVWLVEHILRRSWHMRTAEELETQGRVDIALAPEACRVLTRFDLFKQIEQHLEVKITISPKRDIIQLNGSHERCSRAFIAIYAPLSNIKTQTLSLGSNLAGSRTWGALNRKNLLKNIADVAKVHLEEVTEGSQIALKVSYLAPANAHSTDLDESAYEKVADSIRSVLADSTTEEPFVNVVAPQEPVQMAPLELSPILPIHLRDTVWTRCISKTLSDPSSSARTTLYGQYCIRRLLDVYLGMFNNKKDYAEARTALPLNVFWQPHPTSRITFETGFVAFEPLKQPSKAKKGKKGRAINSAQTFRTFAPIVPGGINALERISTEAPRSETRIILHLKSHDVSPDDIESSGGTPPDLEIHLEPKASGRGFGLSEVQFSIEHSVQQLMLPREVSDARIRYRSVLRASDELDPNIQSWLNGIVCIDGHIDERTVPTSLELDVPDQALLARPSPDTEPESESESTGKETDVAPVDFDDAPDKSDPESNPSSWNNPDSSLNVKATYRLARLEYHDHLLTTYRGCRLAYQIVDAGDMKGRYEKLVLRLPDEESTQAEEDSEILSPQEERDRRRARQVRNSIQHEKGSPYLQHLQRVQERQERYNLPPDSLPATDSHTQEVAEWLDKGIRMIQRLA